MRDVLLWRALHEGADVDLLTGLLEELAAAPLAKRALYLQSTVPLTNERAPRVRAAATRALAGAFGTEARRAIAARLDDKAADVRAAAVDALAACCTHDSAPFACALFHRRADVRQLALERAPARLPVSHQVLLARDEVTRPHVEAMLDRRAADGAIAPALLVAHRLALLDSDNILARLAGLPWLERPGDVLAAMPFAPVAVAQTASADALRAYLNALTHTDPLADALALLWHDDDDGIVSTLIEARRRSRLKDPEHRRVAVAALQVMLTRGASTPRLLALAALAVPMALLLEPDPALRRAALTVLPDVADPALTGTLASIGQLTATAGGDPSLLRDDAGELHLPSVAGALRLLAESPYQRLRDHVPTADVVSAFWKDPLASMALLSLPPRAPADREAYRALLKGVIEGMRTAAPEVVAALAVCLPSEGSFALEDLDKRKPGVVARALLLLLADRRAHLDDISARHLERNTATLAAQLPAAELANVLAAVVRVARLLPSAVAAVEPVPAALLAADAVLRACPKLHLAAALAPLDDEALAALVARLDERVLPMDAERAWALLLAGSRLAAARSWAEPRLAVRDAPREIGAGLKLSLETCRDSELPLMASVFLREPLRGLTDVLAARAPTSAPSARLAATLLASHDPPHAVADAFQSIIIEEPAFLAAIDHALLDEDTRRDLPLLATAWVHHDAGQAVRFEHHCRTVPGGPRAVVELALALPSPLLSWKVMRALVEVVRCWTFQRQALLDKLDDRLAALLLDILEQTARPRPPTRMASTFAGARALRRLAAELIALAHASGKATAFVAAVRERLLRTTPDLESDVRAILKDTATWTTPPTQPTPTLERAREQLRSPDARAACAAVDELNGAGPAGAAALVEALRASEPPPCLQAIIERAIFHGDAGRRLLADDVDAEVRFRVALRLDDGKCALAAACAPSLRRWLVADDVSALAARVSTRAFAFRLAVSPHAPAYTKAVWSLLSLLHDQRATSDASISTSEVRRALLSFLEVDDDREPSLRAEVAAALLASRHTRGGLEGSKHAGELAAASNTSDTSDSSDTSDTRDMCDAIAPVVLCHVLELSAATPRHESVLRRAVSRELWRELIAGAELAGDHSINSALESLMDKRLLDDELAAAVALLLLRQGVDTEDARPLFAVIRRARLFAEDDLRIDALREAVQWGMRQARVLLGRPVSVEMIHDAFGYTRLHQPRIFINPLPLLRGERGGDEVVRGLMVHEIGHHRYHADELGKRCWATAQQEEIQGLLNLVADEHLERNLRAESETYGDHLKVLAAYAFQHASRDVWVEHMLVHLGRDAALLLPAITLMPGTNFGSVQVELGRLLAELSGTTSFARFMRALRMGLGASRADRDDDPKVRAALALFQKASGKRAGFRAAKMDALLEIARELKRIFGDETKLLETFGLHETMDCGESDLMEEGFSPEELQRELDRKSGAKRAQKVDKPKWNDGPGTSFDVIEQVVALPHDPVAHRAVAEQGRAATRSIKKIFDELGTKIVVEHRRLSGRSLDRQGLQSAILRMDPRLLVRRTPVPAADLFVGIVVDCSGSMASEQSMDKARVFATSLAEAARGRSGIDVKVFGFTDSIIYEAGNAERCAAHALSAGGGNNDAAGLWHAAVHAKRSKRKRKLLVMVSDGLPTECSAEALRSLALRLERSGMLTAQVAVRPIATQLFRHYIEILDDDVDDAARRFARVIAKLVRKTVGRS